MTDLLLEQQQPLTIDKTTGLQHTVWPPIDILEGRDADSWSTPIEGLDFLRVLSGFEDVEQAKMHAEIFGNAVVDKIIQLGGSKNVTLVLPHNGVSVPLMHLWTAANERYVDLSGLTFIHEYADHVDGKLVRKIKRPNVINQNILFIDNGTDTGQSLNKIKDQILNNSENPIDHDRFHEMFMVSRQNNGVDISRSYWTKAIPMHHYLFTYAGFDRKLEVTPEIAARERNCGLAVIAGEDFTTAVNKILSNSEYYEAYKRVLEENAVFPTYSWQFQTIFTLEIATLDEKIKIINKLFSKEN